MSEAAKWYGSSRQNVKQIAEQLEKRGYLLLEADSADARAIRLRLTAKIKLFDTRLELARQEALMNEVFAWAKPGELETFHRLLSRWISLFIPKE